MACLGRRSCANDNDDCIRMNVVSGASDENNGCGCNCGCNCCNNCGCGCGCGCNNGNVGGVNNCRNCGPCQYVTTSDCDCEEVEETTCGCSLCD